MSVHNFPVLAGLVAMLPPEGWTAERRAHFLRVFEQALDYSIPIREAAHAEERRQEEAA